MTTSRRKVLCAAVMAAFSMSGLRMARAQESPSFPLPSTVADGAQLQTLYEENGRFFEGPVWDSKTGKLLFTAHANKTSPFQILRLDQPGDNARPGKASLWMNETKGINGMTLSRDGRLLGAQGQAKPPAILSMTIGANGPENVYVVAAASPANPMVETNDLSEDPRGGLYFTAPDFRNKTESAVFYRMPDGKITRVIANLKLPNGVEVSNDGKTLFVSDSFEKRVYSYPIKDDGSLQLGQVRVFFDPPTPNMADPDGMTTDADGNLYFTMRGGVWVVSPEGKSLGLIPVKEFCSNVSFGGVDGKTLFMTCTNKIYSLSMKARGTRWK